MARFRIRLDVALALLLFITVLVVALAALLIMYSSSRSAITSSGERQAELIGTVAANIFSDYFSESQRHVKYMQSHIRRSPWPLMNETAGTEWYQPWFDMMDSVMRLADFKYSQILYLGSDNSLCRTLIVDSGTRASMFCSRVDNADPLNSNKLSNMTKQYFVENLTDATELFPQGYRPTLASRIPSYRNTETITKSQADWRDIRIWFQLFYGSNPLDYIMPLFGSMVNTTGHFLGAMGVIIGLQPFHAIFETIERTENTQIFLIDDRSLITATTYKGAAWVHKKGAAEVNFSAPLPANCARTLPIGIIGEACREYAYGFEYEPLREAVKDSRLQNPTNRTTVNLKVDGSTYYVVAEPAPYLGAYSKYDLSTIRYTIYTFVPEEDLLGEVTEGRNISIAITAVIFVVMLAAAVVFVLFLTKPLKTLAHEMKCASSLTGDKQQLESTIVEVDELCITFNEMQERLAKIKAFVPHSMFTQRVEADQSSSSNSAVTEEATPSNPLDRSNFVEIMGNSDSHGAHRETYSQTAVVDQFVTQPINTFKVTRCTCVVVDWNEVPTDEPDLLHDTVKLHMKAVISAANRYGATIEQLSPEQIVLTFNAHHSTVMHEDIAMKLVMKLYVVFKSRPVVIAVDSSDCLVGTVGYAGRQARVVLGECVDVAKKLPSLQRSYLKSQVLVSERCGRACSKRKFAVVDSLRFNWAQSGRVQKIYVCEALDTTSATDIFSKAYRDGVNDLMRGDLRAATNAWKAMDSSEEQVKRMIQAVGSAAGGKDYHRCELPPWEASGAAPIIPTSPEEIPVTSRLADAAVAALADDTASATSGSSGGGGSTPQDSGVREMAGFLSFDNPAESGVNDQTSFNDISGMAWQRSTEPFAQGQFSRVYQAMGPTGVLCSVKTFQKSAHTFDAASVRAEVTSLARLRHENIVSYVSVAVLNGAIGVITEYVPGGSLNEMQKKFDAIPPPALRRFCVDILKGLVFLHTNGIVHCDIKPHNILLNTDGVIKLADFGSALQPRTTTAPTDDGSVFDLRGTTWYMAPEVAQGEDPSAASDMWSFGITLLELSMGTLPWSKDQRMGNESLFIRELARNPQWMPTIPSTLPDETAKAVRLCLQRDPAARPSSKDLLHGSFTL